MSGPYTVKWGILGGPSWPESSEEATLEDARQVAQANGGTIFDADGEQLYLQDIEAVRHPYRKLAEEIVGTLMTGTAGRIGDSLELYARADRVGGWTVFSALVAVERCLEGSGL